MVDFNSEGTVSKPPKDIVTLIILEKLYNFLEADEFYSKTLLSGASISTAVTRSRLRNLYLVCYEMLKRQCSADEKTSLNKACFDLSVKMNQDEILNNFLIIIRVLDKLQLIKLDTKAVYERHRIEEANAEHGY